MPNLYLPRPKNEKMSLEQTLFSGRFQRLQYCFSTRWIMQKSQMNEKIQRKKLRIRMSVESGYVYTIHCIYVCCINKTLLIIILKDLLIVVAQCAIVGSGFFSLVFRYAHASVCTFAHFYYEKNLKNLFSLSECLQTMTWEWKKNESGSMDLFICAYWMYDMEHIFGLQNRPTDRIYAFRVFGSYGRTTLMLRYKSIWLWWIQMDPFALIHTQPIQSVSGPFQTSESQ